MTRTAEDLVAALWHHIWIDPEVEPMNSLIADPFVRHTRDGTEHTNPEEYSGHIAAVVAVVRGTDVRIDHIAVVDDHVYARLTLQGVNLTVGDPVTVTWLAQYRIAADRIAESWTMHQSDLDW